MTGSEKLPEPVKLVAPNGATYNLYQHDLQASPDRIMLWGIYDAYSGITATGNTIIQSEAFIALREYLEAEGDFQQGTLSLSVPIRVPFTAFRQPKDEE